MSYVFYFCFCFCFSFYLAASYKRCVVSAFNADRTFNAAYAPKANVTNTPYKYTHMGPLVITLEKSSAKDAICTYKNNDKAE